MKLRSVCAWDGCKATTSLADGLPRDWRWLAVWWGPPAAAPWTEGNTEDRDAVLCPQHAQALDSVLKPLKMGESKGSA